MFMLDQVGAFEWLKNLSLLTEWEIERDRPATVSMAYWVTYGGRESVTVVNTNLVGGAQAWDGLVEDCNSSKRDNKLWPRDV